LGIQPTIMILPTPVLPDTSGT